MRMYIAILKRKKKHEDVERKKEKKTRNIQHKEEKKIEEKQKQK